MTSTFCLLFMARLEISEKQSYWIEYDLCGRVGGRQYFIASDIGTIFKLHLYHYVVYLQVDYVLKTELKKINVPTGMYLRLARI